MSNLPVEWKSQLSLFPDADVKRLENLIDRGITHPLNEEKESGAFLLFLMGHGLDEVSSMTGTPKDVIMLTFLKYRWAEKRASLTSGGMDEIVKSMKKNMVNLMLAATNKILTDQIAAVISGKLAPEKCTFLPRSGHGIRQLLEMVDEVNDLSDKVNKAGNTTVNAQNVQINQQVGVSPDDEKVVKRLTKEERLARAAKKVDV